MIVRPERGAAYRNEVGHPLDHQDVRVRRTALARPAALSAAATPPCRRPRSHPSEGDTTMLDRRAEVCAKTLDRIASYQGSKDRWNLSRSLKNLIEQAVRDYEHRALVELLQNAHDAHAADDSGGRVLIRLDHDEGPHGAVYVANTGRPVSRSNFDAITDIAQSDKRPEEGIGNKGIGFKSVLQLTGAPQVYSVAEEGGRVFDGYRFTFADETSLKGLLDGDATLAAEVAADVFHLCLPVPLDSVSDTVNAFAADGYVTVLRLPLKSEGARAEAAQQLAMLSAGPPVLLFLRRIASLVVEERQDGVVERRTLARAERVNAELDRLTVSTVTLKDAGTFVLLDRKVAAEAFGDAVERSVLGDHISEGWRDWQGDARVTLALPVEEGLAEGRLYTHLPMGEQAVAPLPAHVNAPFFAKLARVDLEKTVPLNDFLLDELALLGAETLLACSAGTLELPPTLCADLLSWDASMSDRLSHAFERLGHEVGTAPIVPLARGARRWASLAEARLWDDEDRTLFTTDRLTRDADAVLVHPSVTGQRAARLGKTVATLVGRSPRPSDELLATWAESLARNLSGTPFRPELWGRFYDELAGCVERPRALQGRRILVDDDGKLRLCNVADGKVRRATAFFPPRTDGEERAGSTGQGPRLPRSLRHRVFFVSRNIPWKNRLGSVTSKQPGRRMLEDGGLVHEYRADELLALVARSLQDRPTPELAAEVLAWAFRLSRGDTAPPWRDIRAMRLLVPGADGVWIPATKALFSADWSEERAHLLEELIDRAQDVSEELAALRGRLTAPPGHHVFRGADRAEWHAFLGHLGVGTGLCPEPVPRSVLRADGRHFTDGRPPTPSLTPATADVWLRHVRRNLPTDRRPNTEYVGRTLLRRLPGQDDHHHLSDAAKRVYARLVAAGCSEWAAEGLQVTVRRYNEPGDSFTLPTPATAFLAEAEWMPVASARERADWRFVRPADAWTHGDEAAPSFVPLVPSPMRRAFQANDRAIRLTKGWGLERWDSPDTAARRVRELTELFGDGAVPETMMAAFRRAYEDAWVECAEACRVPFPRGSEATVVVSRGGRLETVTLADGMDSPTAVDHLYVEDTDARQLVQLLEQRGAPLLRMRNVHGNAVAALLEQCFGSPVRRISRARVEVRVDGEVFHAGTAGDPLITSERDWVLTLVAAVIDLRSGRFRRPTTESVRRGCAVAKRIRIVHAGVLTSVVDEIAERPGHGGRRWLAVPHQDSPTLLLEGPGTGEEDLLQRSAAGIMELLHHPELADTLRMALLDLNAAGWGTGQSPDADAIADVLGEDRARVREIAATLRQPLDALLDILVPLLATLDLEAARALLSDDEAPASDEELDRRLAARLSPANHRALRAAARHPDLDTARRAMSLSLPELNAAITALGSTYRPLRNAEGIEQEFRHFVAGRRRSILDALRAGFLDAFRSGAPLTSYSENRNATGLVPDAAWADEHLHLETALMQAHVDRWLTGLGAPPLGGTEAGLVPVDELRLANRPLLLAQLKRARTLIHAWEAAHALPPSGLPGDPESLAAEAAAAGLLDFLPLDEATTLRWLRMGDRWPAAAPLALTPEDLGLSAGQLGDAERREKRDRRLRQEERRHIVVDRARMSAEEDNYHAIVEAVRGGLTPEFLGSAGDAPLVALDRQTPRPPGPGRPGFSAGRRGKLSDTQALAVGLAGEVAALDWLRNRYDAVDESAWVSGYRNKVLGDGMGDDSLGYDLVVERKRSSLLFEVKSSAGGEEEFVLSPTEIARARSLKKRETFHVLYVSHALDADLRKIHLLPNPLHPRSAHFFRSVGEGLRYRFQLSRTG
ncbi:sacsin N-terminal ATP-binding-like domain-containing protein [Streptomyces sp. NPDC091649]|uniref:sacsin N-terminal ATP-binding-like domain-containing protein n=1 Tax=Streptomyces sp. NPDC091649 TaxID=3366004 RepID=UPI003817C8D8